MTKVCKDCGSENDGSNFFKSKVNKDGLMLYCKKCLNKRVRASQIKDPTALIRASVKQNAKRRGLEFSLSREFIRKIKGSDAVCDYCGVTVNNYISLRDSLLSYEKNDRIVRQFKTIISGSKQKFIEKMSIDRKDNSLGYTEENCVPCCFLCNFAKGSFMFYSHAKSILPEIMQDLRDRLERDGY